MEPELFAKLVGIIVAVLSAGRIIYDLVSKKQLNLRDEYRFAKEFLEDLGDTPTLHPFVIEKGYQAIAGTTLLSSKEVAYILTLKNSAQCLKDLVFSYKYLEHIDTTGNHEISFKPKYNLQLSRQWRKILYLFFYFVSAFVALSPFLAVSPLGLHVKQFFAAIVITLPVFGFYAWFSIQEYVRLQRAEILVTSQDAEFETVLLPT
jgi:hypothetical protein